MKYLKDTIISQCTPIGYSGVGIIRISGKKSKTIYKKLTNKKLISRYARYTSIKNKNNIIIDYCILIYFKSPNSFTGEDILEIQSHGGQKIIELIIKSIFDYNIKKLRISNPGEFTERAFWNKKIDLIQAESINDITYAKSENTILLAIKSLKGKLSKKIKNINKLIQKILIFIEKEISFSDKKITKKKIFWFIKKIYKIKNKIKKIYLNSKKSIQIKEGLKIAIVGKPNVGKSSLINSITMNDTSIVSNIPGTTRDIIKENIIINNINAEIIDTAGIHNTNNKIEKIGIKKTWKTINNSNIIIFITEANKIKEKKIIDYYKKKISNKIKKNKINILIRNKIDITKEKFKIIKKKKYTIINLSIKKDKKKIKKIIKIIKEKTKYINIENNFLSQKRHIHIIKIIYKNIKNIKNIIKIHLITKKNINFDIIYEYLVNIQQKFNEITGEKKNISKDIIKNIFKNFCIGK